MPFLCSLQENRLGAKGAEALSEGLALNKSLTSLNLGARRTPHWCRLNGVGALLGRVNASYTGAVTGGVTPSVFLSIFSRRRLERAKIVGAFSSARISDFWTALLHRAAPRARCTHLAAPHELFSHPPTTGHRLPARSEMTSAVTRRVRLTVWRARLHTAAPPNPNRHCCSYLSR